MKVKTQTFEEACQEEYNRHKRGETIRDPHIKLYFLQRYNTIGELAQGKPEVRIIHCPSDDDSFFMHPDPKESQ